MMMKRILYLMFFCFFIFSIQAQNVDVDSLINKLATQKLMSAEQLDLYDKICDVFVLNDLRKTEYYAKKGLAIAETVNDKLFISKFNEYIGRVYGKKANYDTAQQYLEKAINLAILSKDKGQEANTYISMATLYHRQSKYVLSLKYYQRSLPLYENTRNKKQYVKALSNIAGIYRVLKNFTLSVSYLEKAKVIAKKENDLPAKAKIYYDLGSIYLENTEFEKSIPYIQESLRISRVLGNKAFEIANLQALSRIYMLKYRDYEKALELADKSLQLVKKIGDSARISSVLNLMSTIYFKQKRYKESEASALEAWRKDSTDLTRATNIVGIITSTNILLGNKERAMLFFDKYNNLKNRLTNENFRKELMEMEAKYETENKEIRITALEKEKRLYIWLGIACVAVLSLAFGMLFFRYRLSAQKRKIVEQQVKQLEQEKQLIATQAVLDGEMSERSRIARDLHDGLGGMLSVVKLNLDSMKVYSTMDVMDTNRFYKALEMLDQSIVELRRVAHHMMPESLVNYGLKESLEDFCRAIPSTHFQYYGEDIRLDNNLEVLIYRCAYELVNNAVKHANASNINIQLMLDDGIISLTVQDDGIGFDPNSVASSGMGLKNIQDRISAYNGKMHVYSSHGEGTEVSIEIESISSFVRGCLTP